MRAFVTGATGFIGVRLARRLRDRGDDVVCLVRSPAKAGELTSIGCELVQGDLSSVDVMRDAMKGCDAVFHCAGDYRIGIKKDQAGVMEDTNVRGTERVIDAAVAAEVKRIVYVSTIAAFGNTRGEIVDEHYEHPGDSFSTEYERTKYEAHVVAMNKAAAGAPVITVQPGYVYGPDDVSTTGEIMRQAATGKLPMLSFPKLGFNAVHVDDIADALILAYEKGKVGEAYVLGGTITTMEEAVKTAAAAGGRKPPRITMPTVAIKAMIPAAPIVTRVLGMPPNLRELISASDGVTYWARDDKARRELGYAPRDLKTGFTQTFAR